MNQTPGYRVPTATYRLQFNAGFRFVDGRELVPYLNDLGVSDLYSSPRYKARRGSSHGYDVANPLQVNSELGTEQEFDEMADKLRHYEMGLLLDTVPNHMAASFENPWWMDLLENGPASAYAGYFDVEWHPTIQKANFLQDNKVLLPVLGDLYGNVLENGELAVKIDDAGLFLRYYDKRFPLDPATFGVLLEEALRHEGGLAALNEIIESIGQLPRREETNTERLLLRRREKERIKERLWRAYVSSPEVKTALDDVLRVYNGTKGDPRSFDPLDRLIAAQAYRLAFWKIGYEEINYRRFFDVNELVGLRVESPEVFDNRHRRTLELVRSGKVTGLRIDHVDGLWDPSCYLRKLQAALGADPRFYVVVEKILGRDEELPREWPVAGTTGYDFLNALNGIFIDPEGLQKLEAVYSRRTGNYLPFAELCYQSAKQVMEQLFAGEINALGHHLGQLAAGDRQARDVRLSELMQVLVEVTACLPVYRSYIHDFDISEHDRGYIERTLALARGRTSEEQISTAAFEFLHRVLLLEPPYYLQDQRPEWRRFVMRWQQFTGPVMAKGLEDTAAYRHNSLLSLNEVGSDPLRERPPFALEEFHEFNRKRQEAWPHTMNATTTHDTKRGEDLRARLNVLTEIPEEWEAHLERWMEMNEGRKQLVGGAQAPGPAEEVLIYQTLLGAWPNSEDDLAALPGRVKEFLVKALREAKIHSSWIRPQEEYETAVGRFLDAILADGAFRQDLLGLHSRMARWGALNGLAQLVLKVAAPGVPDFYQGTEFWNYSLVDPDNRRPVNYQGRVAMLESLRSRESEDRIGLIRELAADPTREEAKLWVTYRCLQYRQAHRDLFARGEYLPVEVRGACAPHVCAFARKLEDQWVVAAVPRWSSRIGDWGDTELVWTGECHDTLTGLIPASWRAADLFREFPVALLTSS